MVKKTYLIRLIDILERSERILSYIKGRDRADIDNDLQLLDAIERNIEIIGEAAYQMPPEIKEKYPEIEWKKIEGVRHKIVHEYNFLDKDTLWDVAENKIPVLRNQIVDIIKIEEK